MKRCFKLVLQLFDFEISTKIEVFILKNIVLVTMIDFIEVFFITFIQEFINPQQSNQLVLGHLIHDNHELGKIQEPTACDR